MYIRYTDILVIMLNLLWKKLGGKNWIIAPTEDIARDFPYFY